MNMVCEKLSYEQLQEEYERIIGIAREVSGVLALAAHIVRRPLEKDEATGLISVLLNYQGLIDGALPPGEDV
jgi:hypothetical protein